jgi:diaminopimelate epimerase
MKLAFFKYSGNRNDFVLLEHPSVELTAAQIRQLCDRRSGVGADGVLYFTRESDADAGMRVFNSDGLEADMCGNGLRCIATHLDSVAQKKKDEYRIRTRNAHYRAHRSELGYAIEMSEIGPANPLDVSGFREFPRVFHVHTGVPHLVFEVDDVVALDVEALAPRYRHHPLFPQGTNVNFLQVIKEGSARVRTFERGVEGETYSCGTGLTASALALRHWHGWSGAIELLTRGGRQQVVLGETVLFSGEVTLCFTGEIDL